jgi:hypothetical protein
MKKFEIIIPEIRAVESATAAANGREESKAAPMADSGT